MWRSVTRAALLLAAALLVHAELAPAAADAAAPTPSTTELQGDVPASPEAAPAEGSSQSTADSDAPAADPEPVPPEPTEPVVDAAAAAASTANSKPPEPAAKTLPDDAALRNLLRKHGAADAAELLEMALQRRASPDTKLSPSAAIAILTALRDTSSGAAIVTLPAANVSTPALHLGHIHLFGDGTAPNTPEAIANYERAADVGDAEAQFALGVLHSSGFGAAREQPLATTFLHFAAEGGAVGAQLALGYRHLLGVHMPKACQKALIYYNPAAEKVVAGAQRLKGGQLVEKVRLTVDNPRGNAKRGSADDDVIQYYEHSALKGSVDAQLTLGHLNLHGARGMPADATRAFDFYSRAALAGAPAAYAHLGHMYAQGIGTTADNATALECFRKGAAKGHAPSQNGLGYMYMHGFGVAQSHKKALEHFKAAAEKGNAEAQFNLGAMYISGMGVKKAYDKALHYFTLSAHQGHTLALYNLGQMHLNGLGTQRSCPVAVQFLKAVAERGPWGAQLERAHTALIAGDTEQPLQMYAQLAEGGYEVAQSNVAFLLDQHLTHRPDEPLLGMDAHEVAQRALAMYKLAAQQGNVEAELKLGDYHYYGLGTPVDLEASVTHYRAAAESRNAQAMFNLAHMYAHGLGLSRDFHLAKRHYDMAAESATEAYAPVKLAMLELYALQALDTFSTGQGSGPFPVASSAGLLLRSVAAPAALQAWMPELDTLLILVLSVLLALVLLLRRRGAEAA